MYDLFGGNCAVCGKYTDRLIVTATSRVIINGRDAGQFVNLCDEHNAIAPIINYNLIVNTPNSYSANTTHIAPCFCIQPFIGAYTNFWWQNV